MRAFMHACVCTCLLDCFVPCFVMGHVLQFGEIGHKRVHYYYYYLWFALLCFRVIYP